MNANLEARFVAAANLFTMAQTALYAMKGATHAAAQTALMDTDAWREADKSEAEQTKRVEMLEMMAQSMMDSVREEARKAH